MAIADSRVGCELPPQAGDVGVSFLGRASLLTEGTGGDLAEMMASMPAFVGSDRPDTIERNRITCRWRLKRFWRG